jgi:hypothetical protein
MSVRAETTWPERRQADFLEGVVLSVAILGSVLPSGFHTNPLPK